MIFYIAARFVGAIFVFPLTLNPCRCRGGGGGGKKEKNSPNTMVNRVTVKSSHSRIMSTNSAIFTKDLTNLISPLTGK